MKVAVIGATGLIGSRLVESLIGLGEDVVAASPSVGVDSYTGEGLDRALEGADVVIDVTNASSFGDNNAFGFFRRSGANLTAAAAARGVGHYIALSVVGTDRLVESDYFRAKMVQENLVRASGLPFTVLRSTQFFESCNGIVGMAAERDVVKISSAMIRPVAAADTVSALVDVARGEPANCTLEIGGPEELCMDDLARTLLVATDDTRSVITDDRVRYFDVALCNDTLLPSKNATAGTTRLGDWLYQTLSR